MNIDFFLDLAVIIIAAKSFGLLVRKIHIPQVVGEIVAGLLIGPNVLHLVDSSDFLSQMSSASSCSCSSRGWKPISRK